MSGTRRTLERLLGAAVRSRWAGAVVLSLMVLLIVGIGRLVGGGTGREPLAGTAHAGPTISADPKDDDTVTSVDPPPSPRVRPGTAGPEAVAYAFATAWVDHQHGSADKWHAKLVPNATKDLAEKLSGVDPAGVPAERVVGRPSLVPVGESLVEAIVTMDTGKLRLRLIAPDGHWRVDGVDWEQA